MKLMAFFKARPALFILCNSIIWFLLNVVAFPVLDPYGDMIEAFAFTPNFEWGTFKHPPLSGWVSNLWFSIFPHSHLYAYLLCAANLALAMWGVMWLAKLWLRADQQLTMLILLSLTLPFSTLAFKFNANSVLLPIWPWIVYFFEKGVRSGKIVDALCLGLFATLGMLGKYYTGVLLLSIFIAAAMTVEGRKWLLSTSPWISLATFSTTMSPHVLWFIQASGATLNYVGRNASTTVDILHLISFSISPLLYAGFSWLIMLWISESDGFLSSSRDTLQLANKNDRLFWITITPLIITLLFAATGYVKLAIHWAIPLAFIYPLFWLARPVKLNNIRLKKLEKFVPMFWVFAATISVSYLVWQDYSFDENYYTNDEGIAKEIARDARRNGIENLAWVSGGWPEVAIIPFFADTKTVALPAMPNMLPHGVSKIPRWEEKRGVILCKSDDEKCQSNAAKWLLKQQRTPIKRNISSQKTGYFSRQSAITKYCVYYF
ncbi:glycosyltransferase family 39 protein [Chromobacterium aquaticum]|uniref:Glycosyltransferase family 39 protein n=1 Tax=Chromobacterium aquaticum TaxID=467180 RepID=A0ABV9A191_9NEIS|nr:glycosyltransferase family 39 protein [Chromobacterium aquaticum]MCD5363589.1 glycosyltransferase family 39 protein [Chromobacterium aquaticum]